jgi:deoxyribodipyrimidine photolyase-related protein
MTALRLVLGDQLNPLHSWYLERDDAVVYVLMEIRAETDYAVHHAQKVIAVFAAMRDFARWLAEQGHRVRYLALDDPDNLHTFADNLDRLAAHYRAHTLCYQAPDEWRLDQVLEHYALRSSLRVTQCDSEHFYTTRYEVAEFFGPRKRWVMESFYRHMRRRTGVLLDSDGGPEGQRWNFDQENRKPWRGKPSVPELPHAHHDHSALWRMIQAQNVRTMGEPCAEHFGWPLNRVEALRQLDAFVVDRLPYFGAFQDALAADQATLFHSLLSFALNTKMLHPHEVVERACAAWRNGLAPLAAVEGFVRQILGWREYVRGYYWASMPSVAKANALDHSRPLPEWFWTGRTHMRCLAQSIGQSLKTAYAHHIQRLMVIGNFALLAGVAPHEVHRWYLGIYIDAFEWVELPNTLGMSQHADGGRLASKPYVSSAAYIQRMSDYCSGCRYTPHRKTGSGACPYNALYWDFFERNRPHLAGNPRLSLTYRQLDTMDEAVRSALGQQARFYLDRLDQL